MNCKDANKKISLQIDGLLEKEDELILMEHINDCKACKKLYDDTKALVGGLVALPEVPLPEGTENKIHFALLREAQQPKKKKWVKFTVIAMPAAVAVFAAIIGFSYIFSGGFGKKEVARDMMAKESENIQEEMFSQKAAPNTLAESSVMSTEATEELGMVGEAPRMLEESADTMMSISEFSVNVVFAGESQEEIENFAQYVVESLEGADMQKAIFDGETQSIKVFLPIAYYEDFLIIVRGEEKVVSVEQPENQDVAYEEDLLFEVNFLFQKNN